MLTEVNNGFVKLIVHLFYHYSSTDKYVVRRWIYGILERMYLSMSDEIVTSSDFSSREIRSLGIEPGRVHVHSPGLDKAELTRLSSSEEATDGPKIICVANFIPRKGILFLIEAFARVSTDDFTLHLAGNCKKQSTYYAKLRRRACELGIEKKVFFHKGKDRETIKRLYSNSDIFVLPSLNETFGIVLIEAMHYKLPIVAANSTAIPDLLEEGVNGLLVPCRDSLSLAEAIQTLIDNPQLRKDMGESGYRKVSHSFCWDETCNGIVQLLESCSRT